VDPTLDKQLQDAADAIKTWLAVVEYGMIAVVILLFLCFVALLVTMYHVVRLRDELPKHQHTHVTVQQEPQPPQLPAQFESEFRYGVPDRVQRRYESREH